MRHSTPKCARWLTANEPRSISAARRSPRSAAKLSWAIAKGQPRVTRIGHSILVAADTSTHTRGRTAEACVPTAARISSHGPSRPSHGAPLSSLLEHGTGRHPPGRASLVEPVVQRYPDLFEVGTGDLDMIGREARDSQLPADDPPALVLDERPHVIQEATLVRDVHEARSQVIRLDRRRPFAGRNGLQGFVDGQVVTLADGGQDVRTPRAGADGPQVVAEIFIPVGIDTDRPQVAAH